MKTTKRKEIQPNDIWNKESKDKIKEHILNLSKKQNPKDRFETELMAKKYKEEDKLKKIKELHLELIKARNEINIAWIKLDYAVTNYNMIENQLRVQLGLEGNKLNKKKNERKRK